MNVEVTLEAQNTNPDFFTTSGQVLNDFLQAKESWVFIAGPLGLLLVVALVIFILRALRNRKEKTSLSGADTVDHEVAQTVVTDQTTDSISAAETSPAEPSLSWSERLRSGLTKTRQAMGQSLQSLFSGAVKLDEALMEQVHEALYRADVGVQTADDLVETLKERLKNEETLDWPTVSQHLQDILEDILQRESSPLGWQPQGPTVILVVGVNGVGKTTTIGKLASHFQQEGKTVLLAAADTFRAAAIDQLKVWADRIGVDCIAHKEGADPAAVAYDAVKAALARKSDILIVDTAGRLHSKKDLMAELEKITRVMGKDLQGAPHETWIVVDATTGQNAAMQVKSFREVADVSGIIVTKLDGTAKGGVVVGIANQQRLPIRYIGVGEQAEDLRPFTPREFAEALFQS